MAQRGRPRKTAAVTEAAPVKRAYTIAPAVIDPGIACPHCKNKENHRTHDVKKTVFGSRHYMTCGGCGKRFVKLLFKTKSAN